MSTTITAKKPLVWSAKIVQTGTNAPVITVLVNQLGLNITTQYFDVGQYTLQGFNGLLTGAFLIEKEVNLASHTHNVLTSRETNSIIGVGTFANDVFANDILFETATYYSTITVSIY
jgi:hypothetical protein